MLKNRIRLHIRQLTQEWEPEINSESFTAEAISGIFKIKRNTASHYLNELCEDGLLLKINTRPVYFFDREVLAEKYQVRILQNKFASLDDLNRALMAKSVTAAVRKNIFEDLIGAGGSLKKTIEQVITSVLYPPKGLPVLITGPTGVGKSHLAGLIYKYSIEMGVISKDAPFIVFNCAQYYNNPELLSTNLFGYVKGTFTGASSDKEGMLEKADRGILFLDEIHRLSPEGQEKLFNFMDKGIFRRMGENTGERRADVRLIFATTADLDEYLLDTFLRRIPIVTHMPDLQERGNNEKLQFIYSFFLEESRLLNRNIILSPKAADMLLKHKFKGNIGELMNAVKYACAKEYSKNTTENEIKIRLSSFQENYLEVSDHDRFSSTVTEEVLITPEKNIRQLLATENESLTEITTMFLNLYKGFEEFKNNKIEIAQFEIQNSNRINMFLDYLIFKMIKQQDKDQILHYLMQNLNGIINFNQNQYGNVAFVISNYLYLKSNNELDFSEALVKLRDQLYRFIIKQYPDAYKRTRNMMYLIDNNLDISLSTEDEIFFTLYLKSLDVEDTDRIKVVLLAHGYATASSIANVANRLLKKNIFEAFDMPIEVSVKEIVSRLKQYIDNTYIQKGLIIMVDTGSLQDIYSQLKGMMNGPVAVINNASTQMALDIGNMICANYEMEVILEKALSINKTRFKIIYPKRDKKRAIITTCMTGMGTACKIKKLLEESLPENKEICVEAYEFKMLKSNGILDSLFQRYEVMAIVGTDNPQVPEIRYISLEDIISGRGEENLRLVFGDVFNHDVITEINRNIVRNFSLERVIHSLTILNTDNIIRQIEEAIIKLEAMMNRNFSNDLKISLYIHISCMIERLIRQCPITDYENLENFVQCQEKFINFIKSSFSVIENMYGVSIVNSEIGYIYDIITLKMQE